MIADSNVIRLIRRYDPVGTSISNIQARRSLEHTREGSRAPPTKVAPTKLSTFSSTSCSFLPQRTNTVEHEDQTLPRRTSTPRLQRQTTIYDQEPINKTQSIEPIIKTSSDSSHVNLRPTPNTIQPLTIDIEPHVPTPPVITKDNRATYQPLITTGTKRVCAAVSKSEWDLRLQPESPPSVVPPVTQSKQSPSPRSGNNVEANITELSRPLFSRSKSAHVVDDYQQRDDDLDDFDEHSAPIISGSSVNRLKKLFVTKSSVDLSTSPMNNQYRGNSIESNLNRNATSNRTVINRTEVTSPVSSISTKLPTSNSVESQLMKAANKPTTLVQTNRPASSPLTKAPIMKSEIASPSSEPINPTNNNTAMPSSDLTYDAYRFPRFNEQDYMTPAANSISRLRNIAKVEPYSINSSNVQRTVSKPSLASSTKMLPNTTTTAPAPPPPAIGSIPPQTRAVLNSMGNTPMQSSTSSSAGSLTGMIRHPNVRHSDFLVPNPTYSTSVPAPSQKSQPFNNPPPYGPPLSTSSLLTEPLSQPVPQRITGNNNNTNAFYNARPASMAATHNDYQQKLRSAAQEIYHPNKPIYTPSVYQQPTSNISRHEHTKYEAVDPRFPSTSYHYRPRENAPSVATLNSSSFNPDREKAHGSIRGLIADHNRQQQQQQQHQQNQLKEEDRYGNAGQQQQQQSRRRFQRRKQMKRSKSADLYQEPSSTSTKNSMNDPYFNPTTAYHDPKNPNRNNRSISRDLISAAVDGNGSSSSSESSSSMTHLERVNRAALLRYKSLDSMTFNNRKAPTNRKPIGKQMSMDFDSDDSVCGIPKPRKTIGR